MKVCMITGTFPPIKCGVGDYSKILCDHLNKISEMDLNIITTEGVIKDHKYNIYDIGKNWDKHELRKIVDKVYEINPDIVHIQYPTLAYKKNIMINILPFFLHKKFKIVTTIHEYSDNSKLGKIRIWPNILYSRSIIVVDEQYKKDMKRICFFKNKEINFINIGSNIPKSKITQQERQKIRHNILKNNCNRIMGYFGFINKTKGIESIIYSMNILKQKNNLKTIFLIIAELKKDNEYHMSIADLINKFNLDDYVYITGYLEAKKVAKYINATDFMALPFVKGLSTKNGSFLASMQEGRYVVTTKRNKKKVLDSHNIFYLDKYDDIEAISSIIEESQNNINLNVGNCENICNELQWDKIVNRHLSIYRDLI